MRPFTLETILFRPHPDPAVGSPLGSVHAVR
jgi:hypothetical protein